MTDDIKCGDIVIFSEKVGKIPQRSMGIAASRTGTDSFFVYVFFYNSLELAEKDPDTISKYLDVIEEVAKKNTSKIICESDITSFISISDFFNENDLMMKLVSVDTKRMERFADATLDMIPIPIGYTLHKGEDSFYVGSHANNQSILFNDDSEEIIATTTSKIVRDFDNDDLLIWLAQIKKGTLRKEKNDEFSAIKKVAKGKIKKVSTLPKKKDVPAPSKTVMSKLARANRRIKSVRKSI